MNYLNIGFTRVAGRLLRISPAKATAVTITITIADRLTG